jgi:hypothetical protein
MSVKVRSCQREKGLDSSLKTLVAYRCSFDFTTSTSLCSCSFELTPLNRSRRFRSSDSLNRWRENAERSEAVFRAVTREIRKTYANEVSFFESLMLVLIRILLLLLTVQKLDSGHFQSLDSVRRNDHQNFGLGFQSSRSSKRYRFTSYLPVILFFFCSGLISFHSSSSPRYLSSVVLVVLKRSRSVSRLT